MGKKKIHRESLQNRRSQDELQKHLQQLLRRFYTEVLLERQKEGMQLGKEKTKQDRKKVWKDRRDDKLS
jgi:hypothetical protein